MPDTFVGAIIRNSKGEFLLQKRDGKPKNYPNCWTLFGGKVEKGESPQAAILRELTEEISIARKDIKTCKQIQVKIQDTGAKQIIYLIETEALLTDLILKEGERMEYISLDKLFSREFGFNIKEVLVEFTNGDN